jgi:hypothetical protein
MSRGGSIGRISSFTCSGHGNGRECPPLPYFNWSLRHGRSSPSSLLPQCPGEKRLVVERGSPSADPSEQPGLPCLVRSWFGQSGFLGQDDRCDRGAHRSAVGAARLNSTVPGGRRHPNGHLRRDFDSWGEFGLRSQSQHNFQEIVRSFLDVMTPLEHRHVSQETPKARPDPFHRVAIHLRHPVSDREQSCGGEDRVDQTATACGWLLALSCRGRYHDARDVVSR